jgi:Cupredoxin-like domain
MNIAILAAAPVILLSLDHHAFTPTRIEIPAHQRVVIELANHDGTSEEFDSDDLLTEEVVTPRGKVRFSVGPLDPGEYHFMGEYHPKTAQGVIVAK